MHGGFCSVDKKWRVRQGEESKNKFKGKESDLKKRNKWCFEINIIMELFWTKDQVLRYWNWREALNVSELVEYLKMMADDNSGKGSPGLFTGGSVSLYCIRFLKQVLITWISSTTWKNTWVSGGLGGMGGMSRNSLGGAAQLSPYLNFDPSYLQVFSYLPVRAKVSCP